MNVIKGIGIDIIELDRVKNSLERNNRLVERVLTEKEIVEFNQISSETRKIEFFAGRFSVKEAYAKANGTGIGKLSFKDIEVSKNQLGAPQITVRNQGDERIFVSISHSNNYVVTQVIIEDFR